MALFRFWRWLAALSCGGALLAGCGAPGGLLRPNGIAVASDGSLFVMDRGNYRVVHLSPSGEVLAAFGQLGKEAGDIHSGWDLVLDSAGMIYICNQYTSDDPALPAFDGIKVFRPDGTLLREIGRVEYPADESVEGNKPYGLDIDSQGRIFVSDYGTNQIRVFDGQGMLLATLLGDGAENSFSGLNDVAVDDARGLLYTIDTTNSRIQQFSLSTSPFSLAHRMDIGSYGRDPGQLAHPQGLLVDEQTGRVYVSDMANRRIQAFDSDGALAATFAPQLPVWQVLGMALGPDGAVYATDAFNNAIWVFEANGQVRRRIEVQP